MTTDKLKKIVKESLSEKRYNHSIEVSKEAVRLAKIYGEDVQKAEIAGILHDILKECDSLFLRSFMIDNGYTLSPVEQSAQKLWHAVAGALYIEYTLKITDRDILNAVKYHTTARADMSMLEKVLYLADFTSLDRDYDGVSELRRLVSKNMDAAMKEALRFTINDLARELKPIHENTLAAYNQLICTPSDEQFVLKAEV